MARKRKEPKVWSDDPEVQEAMRRRAIRNSVLRTAIVWTPPFILFAGLLVYFVADRLAGGDDANWFLFVVLGVFTLLFGLQAIHAILDLRAEARRLSGSVTRRWSRTDSFVSKSHYVRVDRQILRGDPFILDGVIEGDRVQVEYYPRTGILISLEKLEVVVEVSPSGPSEPSDEPASTRVREREEVRPRREERRVEPPTFNTD